MASHGSWRRAGRVQTGAAEWPLRRDPYQASYSVRSDWLGLFRRLVDICEPAYAMLHLSSESETGKAKGDLFEVFDGPFPGEAHLISSRSSLGKWRKPDPWELQARRSYRFLLELSWANFFGQFDNDFIEKHAAQFWPDETAIMFTVTSSISDVIKKPEHFASSRRC